MIDAFEDARLHFVFLLKIFIYSSSLASFTGWKVNENQKEKSYYIRKKREVFKNTWQQSLSSVLQDKKNIFQESKYLEVFEKRKRLHDIEGDSQIFGLKLQLVVRWSDAGYMRGDMELG